MKRFKTHYGRSAFVVLLILVLCPPSRSDDIRELIEVRITGLREALEQNTNNLAMTVELATYLHQLDHAHPDGGSRIPEAEALYRRALELAGNEGVRCSVASNLGALLLSTHRTEEALEAIQHSINAGRRAGLQADSTFCGAVFNKGKALGMLGRGEEAQAAYAEAIETSRGVAASTYTKALAAVKSHTPELLAEMEAAARYLAQAAGLL